MKTKGIVGSLAALAAIVASIAALTGDLQKIATNVKSWISPSSAPTPGNSFVVLGTEGETKEASDGRYFNFDAGKLDDILGKQFYHGQELLAATQPDGEKRRIVVFRRSSGIGNASGRYVQWKPRDWSKGQRIYIFPLEQ